MLISNSDGWFPIAYGFSSLVPKVVRGWAPVLAILDSTKLLHLGSAVQDELLLAEGRRRFLLTMSCLRSNVKRDPSIALPGLMIVSLGVSLCEVSFHLPLTIRQQLETWAGDATDTSCQSELTS
jgi:hypothetical protein